MLIFVKWMQNSDTHTIWPVIKRCQKILYGSWMSDNVNDTFQCILRRSPGLGVQIRPSNWDYWRGEQNSILSVVEARQWHATSCKSCQVSVIFSAKIFHIFGMVVPSIYLMELGKISSHKEFNCSSFIETNISFWISEHSRYRLKCSEVAAYI